MHKKVTLALLLSASAATANAQSWDPTGRYPPLRPHPARPPAVQPQAQAVPTPGPPAPTAPSRFAPPTYQQPQPIYQAPAPIYAQPAPLYPPPGAAYVQPSYAGSIAADIERWNALRQTDALPFSAYAGFLVSHRGWPTEAALRRSAEQKAGQSDAYPADVIRFFADSEAPAPHLGFLKASARRPPDCRDRPPSSFADG